MISFRKKERLHDDSELIRRRLADAEKRTSRLETRVKRIELEVGIITARAQQGGMGAGA